MKSFVKLAIVGVSGVVLFKLIASILLPTVALVAGLLGMALKLALIGAVAYVVYSIFCRGRREEKEVEIEIS